MAFFLTWSIRRPFAAHKQEAVNPIANRRAVQRTINAAGGRGLLPGCTPQSRLPPAELWPAPTCCLLRTQLRSAASRLFQSACTPHGSGKYLMCISRFSLMLNNTYVGFSHSYLLTKLSGGTHDDGDGSFSCLQLLLIHDVDQHRPNKGCSFTTASLGYSNHIAPRQSNGNTLRCSNQASRCKLDRLGMDSFGLATRYST